MTGVRIDKWMWAARFFKTRALAAKACELGRVISGDVVAKSAREVKLGDRLQITNEGGVFVVEVLKLGEVRGPATVAAEMYLETEASVAARAKVREERKMLARWELLPSAKPNKRDRRMLSKARGRVIGF